MKAKTALIMTNERANHQKSFGGAFARGLEKHGWKVSFMREQKKAADLIVLWSTRNQAAIARQKALGGEVCILERGYVGDRFTWTSVSFGGGLNGHATFRGPFDDASRWETHFASFMKPWQKVDGGYALILQQVAGDMSLRGADVDAFYKKAQKTFSKDMPVKIRPHPNKRPCHGDAYQGMLTSLQEDLAGAACAITWNSNSGVDAVLAGVPTIAMNKGSMAWGVTGHDLTMPPMPDREKWAHALAWKQWTKEEFENGYCWENISGCSKDI